MHVVTKFFVTWSLLGCALAAASAASAAPAGPGAAQKSDTPAEQAVTALIHAPASPLPAGTRLRSIRLSGGLATVDFSREFKDNFPGGDSQEAKVVNSLLRALGQFPTISRVQILVEGRPIDSLGGTLVISDPLRVIRSASLSPARRGRVYLHRR